ncbi:hypothetical protein [Roseivirga pacifica]|uniref:hypothetical protein n=1 Tax=Roseivirga pacifica TaxID=1267423 RepID=UPI003BAC1900
MGIRSLLILGYDAFFDGPKPEDRLELVRHIPKNAILAEILGLNYRIRPTTKLHDNTTPELQIDLIDYFLPIPLTSALNAKVKAIFSSIVRRQRSVIFDRPSCLFATEEILASDIPYEIDGFEMAKRENWEAIFKYLLLVNDEITTIKEEKDDANINFEVINPKLLPLNAVTIEEDFYSVPYRSYRLLKFIEAIPEIGDELISYLRETYDMNIEEFSKFIVQVYYGNSTQKEIIGFHYQVPEEEQAKFEKLSKRIITEEPSKLIGIRKAPFIQTAPNRFMLADQSFLVAKAYGQFLNDFWFDHLKKCRDENGQNRFNYQDYRSHFGQFFESYLRDIFEGAFKDKKHFNLLLFDDLKFETPQGQIELSDVYLRNGNKVLVGEVKSSSIYDKEKFGGDIETLYKGDRNKFFKDFGVDQAVKHILDINKHIKHLDPGYEHVGSKQIYPCIVVNDPALLTPLMADVFNKRFQELLKDQDLGDLHVKPLAVIGVNDLERLEFELDRKPALIWNLLRTNSTQQMIPPFYNTTNRHVTGRRYPERIKDFYKRILPE